LIIKPIAPSGAWAHRNTTLRENNESSMLGMAISNFPLSDVVIPYLNLDFTAHPRPDAMVNGL
jgi:hypothetical protein